MEIMKIRMKIDDSEVDGEVEDIGNYFMDDLVEYTGEW